MGAIVLAWVCLGFLASVVHGMAKVDEDGSGSAWLILLLMAPGTLVGAGLVMVLARPKPLHSWWTRLAVALVALGAIGFASLGILLWMCDC